MTIAPPTVRRRAGRLLWGLAADVAIFFITVWWGLLCILLMLVTRRGWPADVLGKIWCRWVIRVCGIRVDVEGLEHIDPARSYVIVSNHLSNFDIWATVAALPLRIRFVAKKELLRIPVFGQALGLSDHIVIDRSHPEQAVARINARVGDHIDRGFCILFYAEGTRSLDGKVHPFKKGGVTLAIRTGLPTVPMSVSGTRKFLPKRSVVIRPGGHVKIVLGDPIETKRYPFEQRDELNQLVRDVVIRNYVENY
ncbi:MAG TPA: lysophospholipid acyltransferase family protein [Candidatus Acidoferrales bacterium]|nr:lysophospholipid acyltransferase family protein [Candidatus Acidoferrales bacterium]